MLKSIINTFIGAEEKSWAQMIRDQEQERIEYLERMAKYAKKNRVPRRNMAHMMNISTATLAKAIRDYQIDWPAFSIAPGRKGIPLSKYRKCAREGMSQKQTAEYLGVSGPNVSLIARNHNIKFQRHGSNNA